MSTKSENKATQKAKAKRGKAGIKTHINICKAIQQKSHLSQTLNKGSHMDKDKDSTNQNLKHPLIQTYVNAVETQDTDQDLTCPTSKFQCKKCHKYGHFTSKCLTKPQSANVNTIEEVNAVLAFTKSPHSVQADLLDDSLDAMYICTVNTSKPKRRVFADLQLATQSSKPKYLKVRLDTAADVSMMSKSVYQQLFDDPQCQKLQPVTTNTVMHDHSKADVLGSVTIPILKDNQKHGITFQVVPYEASTLLSCEQVTKHGLVIIPEQKQTPKNAIVYGSSVDIKYINFLQRNKSHQTTTWNNEIKVQYKEIFEGIGTFPGKLYHINTDPSIPPKWLPCRPVPVHQQDEFKKQLNEMLDAGVIT